MEEQVELHQQLSLNQSVYVEQRFQEQRFIIKDFIDSLDVRLGDTIIVYKSGEIIPKVKGVNKDKRPAGSVPYQIGNTCPVCGAPTYQEEGTVDIKMF